jgi:predicted metal-binding membrane protein
VIASVIVATTGAWVWLAGAAPLHPHAGPATPRGFLAAVVMWQAMMVAMMTPTVAPWVLAYARLVGEAPPGARLGPPVTFAAGYFTIWLAYSIVAAAIQMALRTIGPVGHEGPPPALAGGVLLAAGAFQFAPIRQACLTHCRNPLSYLLARWRGGPPGAFRLGLGHGAYCVGCCWLLMLTGFAMGVMNLAWMALLTVMMAVEQSTPVGIAVGRTFGAGLIVWGLALCRPS